jgi:hypothetical protein
MSSSAELYPFSRGVERWDSSATNGSSFSFTGDFTVMNARSFGFPVCLGVFATTCGVSDSILFCNISKLLFQQRIGAHCERSVLLGFRNFVANYFIWCGGCESCVERVKNCRYSFIQFSLFAMGSRGMVKGSVVQETVVNMWNKWGNSVQVLVCLRFSQFTSPTDGLMLDTCLFPRVPECSFPQISFSLRLWSPIDFLSVVVHCGLTA